LRITSRSVWTNALTWQDDEERGPLADILDVLAGGTSRWDETCVRTENPGEWRMCWTYAVPPDYDTAFEWCTLSTDPEPPVPPDPGPPPPGWPDDYDGFTALLLRVGGGAHCWLGYPAMGPSYDAGLGPWGGFEMRFTGLGPGDMTMRVFPLSWVPGAVTWRCQWSVAGGGVGLLDVLTAGGFTPIFPFGLGGIGDCPETNLTLTTGT